VAAGITRLLAVAARRLAVFAAALVLAPSPSAALAQTTPFPHRSHLEDDFRSDPGNANCTRKCHTFEGRGMEAYLALYAGCAACH